MTSGERLRRKNDFDGNLTIGSRQFNLNTGRDVHLERKEREAVQRLNKATGLLREELGIARICPVCSLDDGKLQFIKRGFRHLECRGCRMVYVSPVLKQRMDIVGSRCDGYIMVFYQGSQAANPLMLRDAN